MVGQYRASVYAMFVTKAPNNYHIFGTFQMNIYVVAWFISGQKVLNLNFFCSVTIKRVYSKLIFGTNEPNTYHVFDMFQANVIFLIDFLHRQKILNLNLFYYVITKTSVSTMFGRKEQT